MFSTFFFFDFSLLILVQITLLNSNKVVIVFCGNDFETENERTKKKIVRNDEYRFYAMYHWYVSLLRRWLLVVFFSKLKKKKSECNMLIRTVSEHWNKKKETTFVGEITRRRKRNGKNTIVHSCHTDKYQRE